MPHAHDVMQGRFLTQPILFYMDSFSYAYSFLCGKFLLHALRDVMWGVFLNTLCSFMCEFLVHTPH